MDKNLSDEKVGRRELKGTDCGYISYINVYYRITDNF